MDTPSSVAHMSYSAAVADYTPFNALVKKSLRRI